MIAREGHYVDHAANGSDAMGLLSLRRYELIIVDWMVPGLSGIEVCKQYRARGGQAHVLMLTARTSVDEKALALDIGADDYLCKPFHLKELIARVKALLRRPATRLDDTVQFGDWQLHPKLGTITSGNKSINLLPREMEILLFLIKYKGHYFTAEALL